MPINFLSSIDLNTMVLVLLFLILLAFTNYILGRVFRDSKATASIIAICVSLLSVYGINRLDWDLTGIFLNWGISEDFLYLAVPIAIIVLTIIFSRKFGLGNILISLGILSIIASFTPLIYEKSIALVVGTVLLVVGIILEIRRRRKDERLQRKSDKKDWNKFKKEEDYKKSLDNNGGGFGGKTPNGMSRSEGIPLLIKAAQTFKRWALKQKNPQFIGSWAMFINYLKRGNWGNSESEIINYLGISQKDFIRIFNRYGKV